MSDSRVVKDHNDVGANQAKEFRQSNNVLPRIRIHVLGGHTPATSFLVDTIDGLGW